jgi:hypothetical protein
MAQSMPPAGQLITTAIPSRDLGFTDCAYVHADDLGELATAAGIEPASAQRRGMLCHVGEAVLYVKCVRGRARNIRTRARSPVAPRATPAGRSRRSRRAASPSA